jgi:hypothetical protein
VTRRVTFAFRTAKISATFERNPVAFFIIEFLYVICGIFLIWLGRS